MAAARSIWDSDFNSLQLSVRAAVLAAAQDHGFGINTLLQGLRLELFRNNVIYGTQTCSHPGILISQGAQIPKFSLRRLKRRGHFAICYCVLKGIPNVDHYGNILLAF